MGIENEKPSLEHTEEQNNKSYKFVLNRHEFHNTHSMIDIFHPTAKYLASLYWVGKDPENHIMNICQPAIFCPEGMKDRYLSYNGKANFILAGDKNDYDFLRYPFNGSVYKMTSDTMHYFKTEDPITPNYQYALRTNNESIIMDNISIFNESYDCGCTISLQARFEGKIIDDNLDGNIIILVRVDTVI